MLISLKDLINEMPGEELDRLLSSFECVLDGDIEYFLKSRAISYEELSKARTYLIFDESELAEKNISEVAVLGYIALALKVLTVPEETSNRVRKEIDGLSAKIHGEQITAFPVYLIGQLGRNNNISSSDLSGEQLIEYAYQVMQPAVNAVGGRYILVECHEDEHLVSFYRDNGFTSFANIPDQEKPMVQMIRKI